MSWIWHGVLSGRPDSSTCYKGQGFGECRWPSLGESSSLSPFIKVVVVISLREVIIFLQEIIDLCCHSFDSHSHISSGNQWFHEVVCVIFHGGTTNFFVIVIPFTIILIQGIIGTRKWVIVHGGIILHPLDIKIIIIAAIITVAIIIVAIIIVHVSIQEIIGMRKWVIVHGGITSSL